MKDILKTLALSILAVFAPIKAAIITILVLVMVDLITGISAAKKRKDPITSAGFRRTIVKLVVYEGAMMLGFIAQKYLMEDSVPVANIISGFIGITELKSCLENMNTLSGTNVLETIVNKLGSENDEKK